MYVATQVVLFTLQSVYAGLYAWGKSKDAAIIVRFRNATLVVNAIALVVIVCGTSSFGFKLIRHINWGESLRSGRKDAEKQKFKKAKKVKIMVWATPLLGIPYLFCIGLYTFLGARNDKSLWFPLLCALRTIEAATLSIFMHCLKKKRGNADQARTTTKSFKSKSPLHAGSATLPGGGGDPATSL